MTSELDVMRVMLEEASTMILELRSDINALEARCAALDRDLRTAERKMIHFDNLADRVGDLEQVVDTTGL